MARLFTVGDIHGCYNELMTKLDEVGFDRQRDTLWALGDLVDRGPDSEKVVRLLNEPWFNSIKGNHEVLMEEANKGNSEMHLINGGHWFGLLPQEERDELVSLVEDLSIATELTTPSGRKVGLVHADIPGADWAQFMSALSVTSVQDYAMWAREKVQTAKRGDHLAPIAGIDHVYFGHTPVKSPVRAANMSWIDTGCFSTGNIWVEELR